MTLQLVLVGEKKRCSRCRRALKPGEMAFWSRSEDGKVECWCVPCDVYAREAAAADAELAEQERADKAELDLRDHMEAA